MRKAAFVPLLAALAFAAPAAAGTGHVLKGVVIARLPHQGELVIAAASGHTTTLRAPVLPGTGTVIAARAFGLSDGTSATSHLSVVGHARRARFNGILVRTVGGTSFFAVGHSVVATHSPARSISSARSDAPLQPGEAAEIEVTITAGGTLNEDSVTPKPADDANEVNLQVTIVSVTPATATTAGSLTLTINGQTLVIPLPAGTVLPPAFVANATVGLKIEFRQPSVGDDDHSGPGRSGDDDPATTTTVTTIPTGGTTTATTTTTTSHRDGDGDHRNRGPGGGGDD